MIDLTYDFYEVFAKDEEYAVQEALITRLNIPANCILTLALNTKYITILQVICEHPNTCPELLKTLSKEKNDAIKLSLVKNKNIPHNILVELSKDPNLQVSSLAKDHINYNHF